MEWIELLRDFGLPTLLLLLFVHITHKMIVKVVVPWVKELVDSHLDFVLSMKTSTREANDQHKRIWESIDKLADAIGQVGADVQAIKKSVTSNKDEAA